MKLDTIILDHKTKKTIFEFCLAITAPIYDSGNLNINLKKFKSKQFFAYYTWFDPKSLKIRNRTKSDTRKWRNQLKSNMASKEPRNSLKIANNSVNKHFRPYKCIMDAYKPVPILLVYDLENDLWRHYDVIIQYGVYFGIRINS